MTTTRLTREQSRQQTRQRLLAAAAVVFPREGFQGASVEDIAAEAGFSRGAFYSNFNDKDELLAALLQQLCEAEHRQLDAIFEAGGSADAMRVAIREFYVRSFRETEQFTLYAEAKIHAARVPAFRPRLLELERITRARITGFVERYCRAYRLDYPEAAFENIAIGLMALTEGMTFAQMLDPDKIDDDKASAVLTSFFDAIIKNGTRA